MTHFIRAVTVFVITLPAFECALAETPSAARVDSLYKAKQYDSALSAGLSALAASRALTPNDSTLGRLYFQLGMIQSERGEWDSAASWLERAVANCSSQPTLDSLKLAHFTSSLATAWTELGRYAEAEPAFKRSLAFREAVLGQENIEVAASLNNLAILYRRMGRYRDSEALLLRSLAIREAILGPDHPRVAGSLQNLGNVTSASGRYKKAESYYRRALEIKRKTLPPDDPSLATSLHGLAIALTQQGRFGEAETLSEEAIDVAVTRLGADHPAVARYQSDLGVLLFQRGQYDSALAVDRRALAIRRSAFEPRNPEVASSENNLGRHLSALGQFEEAEPLLSSALNSRRAALGAEHPELAESIMNLAEVRSRLGRLEQSDSLYLEALDVLRAAQRPDPVDMARVRLELGRNLALEGRPEEALPLLDSALRAAEAALPREHPALASFLIARAGCLRALDRGDEGLDDLYRAFQIRRSSFAENAMVLPEPEALEFAHLVRAAADLYLSQLVDLGPPDSTELQRAADLIASTKGSVSDEMFARRQSLFTSPVDSSVSEIFDAYLEVRSLLAHQFVTHVQSDVGAPAVSVDSLTREAMKLETELARSAAMKRDLRPLSVSCVQIAARLPDSALLVEYHSFLYRRDERSKAWPRLLALLLERGLQPVLLELDGRGLDSLLSLYTAHFRAMATRAGPPSDSVLKVYQNVAGALALRVWQPVEEHLDDSQWVVIAPDAELNLVSFAGLPGRRHAYLIEDRPLHYVTAARDLLRLNTESRSGHGLLALGDPDFDASPLARRDAPATQSPEREGGLAPSPSVRSGCTALNEIRLARLGGTRSEVNEVSQLWRPRGDEVATVCLGAGASEDQFKRLAVGARVLHLATHGYFLDGECGTFPSATLWKAETPLLLSGLFLAGANLHGSGADSVGVEDGVLTADEVASLDLRAAELVVLSACETGSGRMAAGEGVFGLRRAFEMAGAATVVGSLWRVPDQETSRFMKQLYAASGESYPALLRQAACASIHEQRSRGRAVHPFGWGAFVASGDWRVRH